MREKKHDTRNMLAIIASSCEYLFDKSPEKEDQEAIYGIYASAVRLAAIVDPTVDFQSDMSHKLIGFG